MRQGTGKKLTRMAWETGIPFRKLLNYCKKGLITGAQFNPVTWQWLVYPPCRIVGQGNVPASTGRPSKGSGKHAA